MSEEVLEIWSGVGAALATILDAPLKSLSEDAWSVKAGAASSLDCVDLRSSLPATGRGILVSESAEKAAEGMMLFVPGEAETALAAAVEGRGADEWLAVFATGLGHLAGQAFGDDSPLASPKTLTLNESVWEGDTDPLAPGRLCVCEITFAPTADPNAAVTLRFFAGEEALAGSLSSLADVAASAEGAVSGPITVEHENLLLLRADPTLEERLASYLGEGGSCRRLTELAQLVSDFRDPEVTGAVVEIREGRDYLLPLLRGLKDFPGCETKPMIIVLDKAERMRVRECGRLGLWAVLGAEFSGEDLARRLHEERNVNPVTP